VVAPRSRDVAPVRLLDSSADGVANAAGLLAPGGRPATLTRSIDGPASWPTGTTAAASSAHAPNGGNDGRPRNYVGANAIDGNADTFWNDDTERAYPDVLTIQAPSAVELPGITLTSSADGVPSDFTVEAWQDGAWVQQATITGNSAVTRAVRFTKPVTTDQVRITVTRDQDNGKGVFTRVAEVAPNIVTQPYIDLDFGKVVSGKLALQIAGASDSAPELRLAFSETREYLSDRSDFSRSDFSGGDGTDDHVPASKGETWVDTAGCQFGTHVCATGQRGFRYVRVYLAPAPGDETYAASTGSVRIDAARLRFGAYLGTPDTYKGTFLSSDDLLNGIWYASTYTVELNTDVFDRDDVEPRGAWNEGLQGKVVLHDGAKRDRDPYIGDVAVSGLVDLVSHADRAPIVNVLDDLAKHQRVDGWIPPASINSYTLPLFDYPAWWVLTAADYVRYTDDRAFASRSWDTLTRLMDGWYPSVTDANGLLDKSKANGYDGYGDYAFLPRTGEITYYNANYVRALRGAADLADTLGHAQQAQAWRARAQQVSVAVNAHLWDPTSGAYLDASGSSCHPQDGNAFAILAGIASPQQATAGLSYLSTNLARPWGNAFVDQNCWGAGTSDRVYGFLGYPEVLARFSSGDTAGALEELRREWGWMIDHDPGNTVWEATGSNGDIANYEQGYSSMAHGWAAGAAPALTNELVGVSPTADGFARYDVVPHPGDVEWAKGKVPTPHGAIDASWDQRDGSFTLRVDAPHGTVGRLGVPTSGDGVNVRVDGRLVWDKHGLVSQHRHGHGRSHGRGLSSDELATTSDGRYVYVSGLDAGSHVVSATPAS
jgi:hypothetical protein